MAYNKLNKLRLYTRVIEIVNTNYIDGVTTYAGIWRQYVCNVYPMSYDTFMKIVNMPNLQSALAEAEAEEKEKLNGKDKNKEKND